jgi:hypothetical protein
MRIKDYKTLIRFLKPLIKLHSELQLIWEPELNDEQFAASLLEHYSNGGYYYGEIHNSKVLYFLAVIRVDDPIPLVWLLHVHHDVRGTSKEIVNSMLDDMRVLGKKQVSFEAHHLTSSYERWVRKFGAKKYSINYRVKL